jgi:hypothetical protein
MPSLYKANTTSDVLCAYYDAAFISADGPNLRYAESYRQ